MSGINSSVVERPTSDRKVEGSKHSRVLNFFTYIFISIHYKCLFIVVCFIENKRKNNFSKCYNRQLDGCRTKFEISDRSQNILIRKNCSMNFLEFFRSWKNHYSIASNHTSPIQYTEIRENPFETFCPFILKEKNTAENCSMNFLDFFFSQLKES